MRSTINLQGNFQKFSTIQRNKQTRLQSRHILYNRPTSWINCPLDSLRRSFHVPEELFPNYDKEASFARMAFQRGRRIPSPRALLCA